MKKGCFLKFIIIFTILVGVILYIVQNKFEEYFLNPGKDIVLSVLDEKWDEQLAYVRQSEEKDSLKSLIKGYIKNLDLNPDDPGNKTAAIIELLRTIISDSTVSADELSNMRQIIGESIKNGE